MHSWGSYVLFAAMHKVGSWTAVILFKALIILISFSTILFFIRKVDYRHPLAIIIIALASYAASYRFIARSSIFTDMFLALLLVLLLLRHRGHFTGMFFPLFMALLFMFWANLHPGFFIGLVILTFHLGVCMVECLIVCKTNSDNRSEMTIQAGITLIGAIAATIVNPMGLQGLLFPLASYFDPVWEAYRQHNLEWRTPLHYKFLATWNVRVFLALSLATLIILFLALYRYFKNRKNNIDNNPTPLFEILLFAVFAYLGLSAVRFINAAVFGHVLVAISLSSRFNIPAPEKSRSSVSSLAALLTAAIILSFAVKVLLAGYSSPAGHRRVAFGLDEKIHPVRSAAFFESLGTDVNLFNDHAFGSYLAWRWKGRRKLFYHGLVMNLKFYKKEYITVNRTVSEFDRIVNKYNIGAFFMSFRPASSKRGPLVYRLLLSRPEWHLVYAKRDGLIFLRAVPENLESIQDYSYRLNPDRMKK